VVSNVKVIDDDALAFNLDLKTAIRHLLHVKGHGHIFIFISRFPHLFHHFGINLIAVFFDLKMIKETTLSDHRVLQPFQERHELFHRPFPGGQGRRLGIHNTQAPHASSTNRDRLQHFRVLLGLGFCTTRTNPSIYLAILHHSFPKNKRIINIHRRAPRGKVVLGLIRFTISIRNHAPSGRGYKIGLFEDLRGVCDHGDDFHG